MTNELYPAIFKRKSFHLFRGTGTETLSREELSEIERTFDGFEPLVPGIRTAIRIVPSGNLGGIRDSEYCILIYSETKTNSLMNAGYLGELLDLYLVSKDIGTLWFGIGKPDLPTYDGLDYVIMIAIRKISDRTLYRKDMTKAKRNPLDKIWTGETLGIADIVRFTPSACNSQPWIVKSENGILTVTRCKKNGRIGIMSPKAAFYFNRIDIGIFLCFLEVCLAEKKINAERELFADEEDRELSVVARYRISF